MATSKISLSTDAWTSLVTEAYLGVTCHFIDDNWELVSFNLITLPVEERHTAENIALWLENVAEKFRLRMSLLSSMTMQVTLWQLSESWKRDLGWYPIGALGIHFNW